MVEPVSAAIAGGAIGGYVAKRATDGLARLLGPASDEAAQALQRFTQSRLRNVGRVIEAAERRSGLDDRDERTVPLRVALRVLDEGAYADDDLVVEYLGGVLASSRTRRGRDDRGNTFLSLVSRLSTYHLRTHYVFYTEMNRVLRGLDIELRDLDQVNASGQVFVPHSVYDAAMDYGDDEDQEIISSHSMWWLAREELLGWNPGGSVEYLSSIEHLHTYRFREGGTIAWPTIPGVELYMWALGKGQLKVSDYLRLDLTNSTVPDIEIPPRSCRLSDLAHPEPAPVRADA